MIVVIEDAVFASDCSLLDLFGLFRLGFEGRHRVQTDPLYDPTTDTKLNDWLTRRSPDEREEIEQVLEAGIVEDANSIPSELTIRITATQAPDWKCEPPRIPIEPALKILSSRLRLMVENATNDGAFIRAMAPEPWRKRLQEALDRGWAEFDNGGGLSVMLSRVEELARTDEGPLRTWVMFDSDAREPGCPSSDSEDLRHACRRARVAHHQLSRRASENYLPLKAISAWVCLFRRAERTKRRQSLEAFSKMTPEQRHHYNMRGGFRRDRKTQIPEFFGAFSGNKHLQDGFGDSIRDLFRQDDLRIRDDWLVKDRQLLEETTSMLQAIMRRM